MATDFSKDIYNSLSWGVPTKKGNMSVAVSPKGIVLNCDLLGIKMEVEMYDNQRQNREAAIKMLDAAIKHWENHWSDDLT